MSIIKRLIFGLPCAVAGYILSELFGPWVALLIGVIVAVAIGVVYMRVLER